jgi:hypothetical protein
MQQWLLAVLILRRPQHQYTSNKHPMPGPQLEWQLLYNLHIGFPAFWSSVDLYMAPYVCYEC